MTGVIGINDWRHSSVFIVNLEGIQLKILC